MTAPSPRAPHTHRISVEFSFGEVRKFDGFCADPTCQDLSARACGCSGFIHDNGVCDKHAVMELEQDDLSARLAEAVQMLTDVAGELEDLMSLGSNDPLPGKIRAFLASLPSQSSAGQGAVDRASAAASAEVPGTSQSAPKAEDTRP